LELAGLLMAAVALVISLTTAQRQLRLARHANVVPVLIDVFREHRGQHLADARLFVYTEIDRYDLSLGLPGLPDDGKRDLVRHLMWYYDNVGAMVVHRIVDLEPVSGYLGGSVDDMWTALEPLVLAERERRTLASDPLRWQWYFEHLALQVRSRPPAKVRPSAPRGKPT